MANLFGLPYRIFVCAMGLVIVMLSGDGRLHLVEEAFGAAGAPAADGAAASAGGVNAS